MCSHRLWFIFFIVSALSACQVNQPVSSLTSQASITLDTSDTLAISIEGLDLSEDMSRLSTQNDELMIIIYKWKDSLELDPALGSATLKLDASDKARTVRVPIGKKIEDEHILFWLLEQDESTPFEQIDPVIRVHHQQIMSAFIDKRYLDIEKYLGDEDVLGFKIIEDINPETSFRVQGTYKLDKYDYLIQVSTE